jgi:OMF family outer membrane factor
MRSIIILLLISCYTAATAQNNINFTSLSEVFSYADAHSNTFKDAGQQKLLAKYETLAAKLNQFNVKADANLAVTDNLKLNVSFIPAEIFGGTPGTFKTVTFGQQYINVLNVSPQFDILNPYNMALVKVAKTNESLTAVTNLLNKKSLYESIAAAYYNILSFQWQVTVTQNSLANADTLTKIMVDKQQSGIARQQDVNNAKANQLAIADKLQQLQIQLQQQYNSLKVLCDINENNTVTITDETVVTGFDNNLAATGNLLQQQYEWQQRYQEANLRAGKKWYMPTLSFVSQFAWQQNSNKYFVNNSQWYNANYVGVRLTMPIIPDANKIAAVKYDRIYAQIAGNDAQHAALQDSINNTQAQLDYKKTYNSYQLAQQVEILKEDSYRKNLDIYKEGILSATDLLISFNDWLNSSLNTVAQKANSEYNKSKLIINNTVK